jgi:hypothetical protein
MQLPHSLKPPGFNPRAYKVKNWFQSFAFSKYNLYGYSVGQSPETQGGTFADAVEGLLRAGWNQGEVGERAEEEQEDARDAGNAGNAGNAGDAQNVNGGQKKKNMTSLASVGAAASRRVLAWNEAANAAATADILCRTVGLVPVKYSLTHSLKPPGCNP